MFKTMAGLLARSGTAWRRLAQGGLGSALLWLTLAQADAQERYEILRLSLPQPVAQANPEPTTKTLPISLDTVLRLAQDQNHQTGIARQKLEEAYTQQDLAAKRWLPDVTVGTAYYRHEGGIQDFTGQLIHSSYGSLFAGVEMRGKLDLRDAAYQRIDAERKVWQQKGELSKITSETLLDAATTYIDFLAARTCEAVSRACETQLAELLTLAQNLAAIDSGSRVEVVRLSADIQGQKLITRKLHEGGNRAAAKLVYLLGLDPASTLVPIDRQMVAVEFVNPSEAPASLVAKALGNGPGVRELEGLLNLIETTRARASGPGRFMPTVEFTMAEGLFGAGPGAQSAWDNRWDLGLHVKWNLTEALSARARQRLIQSQSQQAHLSYADLRGKLTLGIHEAREASLSSKDQMAGGKNQIEQAEEAYSLSNSRLKENIKGRSPSEVLMASRTLAGARLAYLQAIANYDKAQLRLFILTGGCVKER